MSSSPFNNSLRSQQWDLITRGHGRLGAVFCICVLCQGPLMPCRGLCGQRQTLEGCGTFTIQQRTPLFPESPGLSIINPARVTSPGPAPSQPPPLPWVSTCV